MLKSYDDLPDYLFPIHLLNLQEHCAFIAFQSPVAVVDNDTLDYYHCSKRLSQITDDPAFTQSGSVSVFSAQWAGSKEIIVNTRIERIIIHFMFRTSPSEEHHIMHHSFPDNL